MIIFHCRDYFFAEKFQEFCLMKKKSNITQLAEYCGVSPSTISRVFNGTTYVAPEKREKIIRAAARFNYIPPAKAQRDTVALITSGRQQLYSPSQFAGMIICHLLEVLSAAGYRTLICRTEEYYGLNPRLVVAGIIIDWTLDAETIKKLARAKIPVIGINLFTSNMNSICYDHAGATVMAVKYLVREGHKKIVFIEPPSANWGTSERQRGYRIGLQEEGITYDSRFLDVADADHALNMEKLKTMLYERVPTAIICIHEDWILQLHAALGNLGFRPGEDISVITGELPGIMNILTPGYTSVAQDTGQLAKAAVQMIENLKDKPPFMGGVMHYMLPCHIIKRKSVLKLK